MKFAKRNGRKLYSFSHEFQIIFLLYKKSIERIQAELILVKIQDINAIQIQSILSFSLLF